MLRLNRVINVFFHLRRIQPHANLKRFLEIRIFSNLDPANIEFENIYTDVTKRGIILNLPGDYQFSPRHSTGQPQEVRVLSKCVLSTQ